MPEPHRVRRSAGLLAALALPLVAALRVPNDPAASPQEGTTLAPTPALTQAAHHVVARLERSHYRDLHLDDALSGRVLDRYLEYLDPTRSYFLASDIREFERYRAALDDALEHEDLGPAFAIYARLQERRDARSAWMLAQLERGLDELSFETDESLELDRSEADWPRDQAEADDLWRKRLKNDVLTLRIADRPVEDVRDALQRRYTHQRERLSRVDAKDVVQIFLNALAQTYDPHTTYFAPRAAQDFGIEMSLSLEGIGALLGGDGEYVRIERLIPGGPAERGGELNAGDRIVGVAQGEDGEVFDIVGWSTDEAVDLIRGPKGSVVRLEILPAEQTDRAATRVVRVVRDEIQLEEQAARKRRVVLEEASETSPERAVGVIELPAFYVDFAASQRGDHDYTSSARDVARLVRELVDEGVDGIVLDLRGNGGGSLTEAIELAGLFLGEVPVVQVRDARGRVELLRSRQPALYSGPVGVLVDRLSASASEIVAAAIQDYGRGPIVGSRTFGKGTVQTIAPVGYGELKFTQAKFYRVSGGSTQSRGVEPDVAFPSTYDEERIGESALEESMPWDSIPGAMLPARGDLDRALARARPRHRERMASDSALEHLLERNELLRTMRRTRVSLKESERRTELEQDEHALLEVENAYRRALGEEPVESLDDLVPTEDEDRADPFQREAAEVLLDVATPPGLEFAARDSGRER